MGAAGTTRRSVAIIMSGWHQTAHKMHHDWYLTWVYGANTYMCIYNSIDDVDRIALAAFTSHDFFLLLNLGRAKSEITINSSNSTRCKMSLRPPVRQVACYSLCDSMLDFIPVVRYSVSVGFEWFYNSR